YNMDSSLDVFLLILFTDVITKLIQYIDERIRFLVDETQFFTSNFLVKEVFIKKKLFTGMIGVVGLEDDVNKLL
ncbi:glycyl radical enzyme domain-containing protein, partial [Clostridium perfringens]